MELSLQHISAFRGRLFDYYNQHGRHELPWRLADGDGFDAYRIVVSELMLQQTQVGRVIPKYHEFLERFPDVATLARATVGDVLIVWQGLGYNRRAKFLWQLAQQVVRDHAGSFPDTPEGLLALPGIGKNTAGAVLAYAFNKPAVFIETNVRTVYIHHFFPDAETVSDHELRPLIAATLTPDSPREFYWALMDYGSALKAQGNKASARSRHHVRQSPFAGSRRQVRGTVLRLLAERGYSADELSGRVTDERLDSVLTDLAAEGLIAQSHDIYHLA